jgi:Phage integrase, N-terminal SAM-like domain
MSLDGYLDKWLETAAKPKLRAKTHRDYEALLRRYVRPALGSRQASKIERQLRQQAGRPGDSTKPAKPNQGAFEIVLNPT